MAFPSQLLIKNRLLKKLSAEAFATIAMDLEYRDLSLREILIEPNFATEEVCFLESGLASIVAGDDDAEAIEVGHLGKEGMTGLHLLLAVEQTPSRTYMQVAGSGLFLSARALGNLIDQDREAHRTLLAFVQIAQVQLSQSTLANGRYRTHERLARWLLMCHDRLETTDLPLTHEFISLMLGVRRSGVTDELHILEGMHAIRSTRGNVHILDRNMLEEIAGAIYGLPEREYERVFGSVA